MNFSLALDHFMVKKWARLRFFNNAFDLGEWRKVSSNITQPKPVVLNIANWFVWDDIEESLEDKEKVDNFLQYIARTT